MKGEWGEGGKGVEGVSRDGPAVAQHYVLSGDWNLANVKLRN